MIPIYKNLLIACLSLKNIFKGVFMFIRLLNRNTVNEQEVRESLNLLSEKELIIEVLIELKKLNSKCDDIARKIVIWSD